MSDEKRQGRYHFHILATHPTIVQVGGLLIAAGILGIIGAGIETGAYVYYQTIAHFYVGNYTGTDYCGYWCGVILVICGAIAVHAGRTEKDKYVIATCVACLCTLAFAIVLIALPAEALEFNDYMYQSLTAQTMLVAADALMISAGGIGVIAALFLGSDAASAIKLGHS